LSLRIVLGIILVVHGWPKIKNLRATAENFAAMGLKPAKFLATIVALLEFFGGLMIVAGLLTQVIAIFAAIQFLVVIFKVKGKQGLVGGYELELLILASAIILAVLGSGFYSLDQFLGLIY
ncbi:MAG: DoxX family protein, partial [Patescibacteria group bacterium]